MNVDLITKTITSLYLYNVYFEGVVKDTNQEPFLFRGNGSLNGSFEVILKGLRENFKYLMPLHSRVYIFNIGAL